MVLAKMQLPVFYHFLRKSGGKTMLKALLLVVRGVIAELANGLIQSVFKE